MVIKTNEDKGIKQFEALKALRPQQNQELESTEGLFPRKVRNVETENEINEIKKWEEILNQKIWNMKQKNTYITSNNLKR